MIGPDPAVARIRRELAHALRSDALPPSPHVLVAFSGGADSLALLNAALWHSHHPPRNGVAVVGEVSVAVVDHGWFPESTAHSEAVARQARELGAKQVQVLRVDEAAHASASAAGGPEALARAQRYELLDGARRQFGAHVVLLGHTQDDQAEQVLMGLVRGSGAQSLAGMPQRRDDLLRPLLGVSRADTERACEAEGLTFWQDPANADPRYTRVRARNVLSELEEQLGPGMKDALARTAEQLRQDAQALQGWAEQALASAQVQDAQDPEAQCLDIAVLQEQPDAVRRRVILYWLRNQGAPAGALASVHIAAVDALVTRWHGQKPLNLPGGLIIAREYGKLKVVRQ